MGSKAPDKSTEKISFFDMLKEMSSIEDGDEVKMRRSIKHRILRDCAPEAKVVGDCYGSGGFSWCLTEVGAFWACYHERLDFYTAKYVKDFDKIGSGAFTKKFLDTDFHWNPKVKERAASASEDDTNK